MNDNIRIPLVLASGSATRQRLLRDAGIEFDIHPADLDERTIIESLTGNRDPAPSEDIALILAQAKAQAVGEKNPGATVIGSDQILSLGGRIFTKPADMSEARRNLLALSGRTHRLHSAVCIYGDGCVTWSHVTSVAMHMRALTPEFVGRYLARAGDDILGSVGCYRLEGLGAQLFDTIDGDFFSVLGLPLLPLLSRLRIMDVIDT